MSMVRSAARWMSHSAIAFTLWASLASVASGQSATPAERWQALTRHVVEAYQAGQVNEAVPLAEQALELAQAFGPRHPNTLISMSNLALVLNRQGRYSEAEPLYRETLQLRREVLGPRHPDTLRSLNNLASVLDNQGRYGEAEPLDRESLQLRREVLGPRHPDTLSSLNNLASVLQSQGRYGEAEPLDRESLQLRREVLGPRHPDTLSSLNNLALVLDNQGR